MIDEFATAIDGQMGRSGFQSHMDIEYISAIDELVTTIDARLGRIDELIASIDEISATMDGLVGKLATF